MNTQTTEMTNLKSNDSYQLIKGEELNFVVVSSQTLAGSRIILSTYNKVVFADCRFYACDFQGVTFENCVFENCNFDFSHLKACKFKNCSFVNCNWKAVSSINTIYEDCGLDSGLTTIAHSGRNTILVSDRDHTTDIYIELALAC